MPPKKKKTKGRTLAKFSSDEDENTDHDTLKRKPPGRILKVGAFFVSSASSAVTAFIGYIGILLTAICTLLLALQRFERDMCLKLWERITCACWKKGKTKSRTLVSHNSSQSCPSPTVSSGRGKTPADNRRKKHKHPPLNQAGPPGNEHHAPSKHYLLSQGGSRPKASGAIVRSPTYDLDTGHETLHRQQENTLIVPEIDLDYIRKTFPEEITKIENDWGVKFVVIDGQLFAKTTETEEQAVHYDQKNEALEDFTTLYQKEMYTANIRRASLKDKSGRLSFNISEKYKRVCVRPTKNSSELEVVGPKDQVCEVEREFGDSDRQVDRQGPSVREVEPHSIELSSISSRDSTGRHEAFHYSFSTGTKLTIKVADITREYTDAIVNAANKHLRHGGGVAAAISRAAGRSFQKDSEDAVRQHGSIPLCGVVTTRAGDLPCKRVIHVVGPTVETPNYQLMLQRAVGNVLDECRLQKVSTVAMPAISTGIFGVPKHEGALCMVRAIQDKLREKSLTLREIRVVDKDYRTIDAFAEVFRRELQTMNYYFLDHEGIEREFGDSDRHVDRQGSSVREVDPYSIELSSISSRDSTGRHEAFHYSFPTGTKLTIKVADITKENTDAIVNAANKNLRHGGGVAAAISRAAGRSFQKDSEDAVRQQGSIPLCGVVTTRAGDLPCKCVIHVVGPTVETPNYQLMLQRAVGNVLDECRLLEVSTVAMPAISTGIFGVPKHEGALCMVRAIQDKLREKSLTLREIRVVDKDYRTIDAFAEVFRRELQTMDDYYQDHEENNASFLKERRSKKHSHSGATVGSVVTNGYNKERISPVQRPPDHHFDHHGGPSQVTVQIEAENDNCPICMDTFTRKTTLDRCRHSFCQECLDRALAVQNKCPICGDLLGEQRGNQPDGDMDLSYDRGYLPGYEGYKTIVINFKFPDGIQQEDHPNPGYPYKGTRRTAFLPDTAEGREVKGLLRRAFDAKLLFTVGRSVTTGRDDTVVWNDVHFKTKRTGGPQRYGYPDPTYLSRVKEELAAKGIK